MTRLVLWRHGLTAWNSEQRMQGQTDVGLSDVGRVQAKVAAEALADFRPDLIVASDLSRAADTAAELAALTGRPVELDSRLRERCYGQWQGLRLVEVERRWPEPYARWRAGSVVGACGVEDLAEAGARVRGSLLDWAARAPGGTVVAVGHGGSLRYGLVALLGWPASTQRALGLIGNCHWVELGYDAVRGWQLRAYNVGRPVPSDAAAGASGPGTDTPAVASE